jgi:hypothetical protein
VPQPGRIAAAALDPAFPASVVTGHKWERGQIIKDVRRSAADLPKAVAAPARRGLRDRTSLNVPAVADSDPEWRIDRNYGRPGTCIPRTGRASATGPVWPVGRDNVRVSPECNDHPRDRHCPVRRPAWIDRGPAIGQVPEAADNNFVPVRGQVQETSPASALDRAREVAVNSFGPARAPALAAAAFSGPLDRVKTAAAFSDPLDQAKAVAEFSDPLDPGKTVVVFSGQLDQAKTVAVSNSVRMVGPGGPTVDPVIVGPI